MCEEVSYLLLDKERTTAREVQTYVSKSVKRSLIIRRLQKYTNISRIDSNWRTLARLEGDVCPCRAISHSLSTDKPRAAICVTKPEHEVGVCRDRWQS